MTYRPIDYAAVRELVPISRLLDWLQYEPRIRRGHQLRGACLLPHCGAGDRTLSIDTQRSLWYCFACRQGGDQLDLWRLVHQRPLYASAVELCRLAGHPVPYRKPISSQSIRPAIR